MTFFCYFWVFLEKQKRLGLRGISHYHHRHHHHHEFFIIIRYTIVHTRHHRRCRPHKETKPYKYHIHLLVRVVLAASPAHTPTRVSPLG